jgi:predicted nucleic acid-binding protein
MKYVLDSSVAFKTLLAEQDSDKAQRLYAGFLNNYQELLAPDVFPIEIGHAIIRAERQGRITAAEGSVLIADLLNRLPAMHPSLPLLPRAYQISSVAFDCEKDVGQLILFIAAALVRQCERCFPGSLVQFGLAFLIATEAVLLGHEWLLLD